MNRDPKRQLDEFFRDELRLSRAEAPSFDELAAYVEVRLDPEERALLEERLAADPALRQVTTSAPCTRRWRGRAARWWPIFSPRWRQRRRRRGGGGLGAQVRGDATGGLAVTRRRRALKDGDGSHVDPRCATRSAAL
jgi:hypothetical protein